MLALSGVSASYGSVPAVSDVSIAVGEGEAAGNQPASCVDVNHSSGKTSENKNGGGGNCTRVSNGNPNGGRKANRQGFYHRLRDEKSLVCWTKRLRRVMGGAVWVNWSDFELLDVGSILI